MINKKQAWLHICLSLPSLSTLLILWITRDSLFTMAALVPIYYYMPKVYNKYARRFKWEEKIPREINEIKQNKIEGNILNFNKKFEKRVNFSIDDSSRYRHCTHPLEHSFSSRVQTLNSPIPNFRLFLLYNHLLCNFHPSLLSPNPCCRTRILLRILRGSDNVT